MRCGSTECDDERGSLLGTPRARTDDAATPMSNSAVVLLVSLWFYIDLLGALAAGAFSSTLMKTWRGPFW